MRIAIIGSRSLNVCIDQYVPQNTELIVSGGAKGIDQIAEDYADRKGIEKLIIKPNYQKFGRGAPLVRNKEIVENADLILAFWDGKSRGTMHSVKYAMECGKEVHLHEITSVEKEAS